MRVPSRDIAIGGGLRCVAVDVKPAVWQEHVVKHPLGVRAVSSTHGTASWDREGWDKTTPPVVTEGERETIVRGVADLSNRKLRCGVPEIGGGKAWSNPDELACKQCPGPIFGPCQQLCHDVSVRYAAATEEVLLEVADGVRIPRGALTRVVHALWRAPEKMAGLTVLTLGLEGRRRDRPIARVSRHDGIRVELAFEEPDRLRWRTTYRDLAAVSTPLQKIKFVTAYLEEAHRMGPLSDLCVVTRHWWEAHGS